ncbi:sodium channel protein Nach-like [Aedes albopictus]|uniref:Pickpocket n=1 Tax=Aedes albopictus TaxID=7160 RepID=A0ABM2A4S4_AEDAL
MASLVSYEPTNTSSDNESKLGQLGYSPAKMLLELNQPCESLIKHCYWLGSEVSCAKFFHVTKTHVGFCCSFNADKAMHVDYKAPARPVPSSNIRLSGAGKHVGLSVMVDIAPDRYMAPTKSYYGAEIFVHSPNDFPADSDFEDTLQPGWDVDFCVTPIPIESSPSLERVPLSQRKCFMPNEGILQSNNTFSLNLCMSECRLRTIIKLCSCVPFYYVDFNITEMKGVETCTLRNVNCLRHFRKYFYSLKPPKEMSTDNFSFDLGMDCNCKPSCTFLNYNVQSISSKRMGGPFTSSYFGGRNVSTYATLHVHFKDLYCVKYRREAFMTWDSLLASFGGIFGLCMGGSVLSIVELFYYFVVKPFAFYRAKQRDASASEQQLAMTTRRQQKRPKSGRMFCPGRYPVGYFERKSIILRERTSGRGKRKILTVSPRMGFGYGM